MPGRGPAGYIIKTIHMKRFTVVCFLLSCAIAALAQSNPPSSLSCPSTLEVTEATSPIEGWRSSSTPKQHNFERVSIYNVDKSGREYDLAPDNETRTGGKVVQSWNLKDYRSMNILLRCRYHDTAVVLYKEAPAALTRCAFTFALDKNGSFIGKSDLVCRH
jgi:hypothetical protein